MKKLNETHNALTEQFWDEPEHQNSKSKLTM